MKKNNKYQEALDELFDWAIDNVTEHHDLEETYLDEEKKSLQELIEKGMYIELGMEAHKQFLKLSYSSEDNEMFYLDLKKYYDKWLEKYED